MVCLGVQFLNVLNDRFLNGQRRQSYRVRFERFLGHANLTCRTGGVVNVVLENCGVLQEIEQEVAGELCFVWDCPFEGLFFLRRVLAQPTRLLKTLDWPLGMRFRLQSLNLFK